MTAFPLFDLFIATTGSSTEFRAPERRRPLMTIAASMVSGAVQEFERIRAIDEALAVGEGASDSASTAAIRVMYEEAAKEAERVLNRIDRFEKESGGPVANSDSLSHWYGKTMAMLRVSLEDIAEGLAQASRGDLVAAGELRNELLA